jgi:hypothetical protein
VHSLDAGYEAWSAATAAGGARDEKLRQWLTEHDFPDDVDVTVTNATTPLMEASRQGDDGVMRSLLASWRAARRQKRRWQ